VEAGMQWKQGVVEAGMQWKQGVVEAGSCGGRELWRRGVGEEWGRKMIGKD